MTTLNALEALAKADDYSTMSKTVTVSKQDILAMIALIRQLGDALKEAETAMVDHGTAYLNHEDEYSTGVGFAHVALEKLKEFDHDTK